MKFYIICAALLQFLFFGATPVRAEGVYICNRSDDDVWYVGYWEGRSIFGFIEKVSGWHNIVKNTCNYVHNDSQRSTLAFAKKASDGKMYSVIYKFSGPATEGPDIPIICVPPKDNFSKTVKVLRDKDFSLADPILKTEFAAPCYGGSVGYKSSFTAITGLRSNDQGITLTINSPSKKISEKEFIRRAAIERNRQAEVERKRKELIEKPAPTMVNIPAGSFLMGNIQKGGSQVQQIHVKAFKIGQAEVTFSEWDACVASGGCTHNPDDRGFGRDKRPVIDVSYNDIMQQFIPWLNNKTGGNYRLPSDIEWEYAARAGSVTKYSWGNKVTCQQARYREKFSRECEQKTAKVKSYPANAFGLYDMHGNVFEWVESCGHPLSFNYVPYLNFNKGCGGNRPIRGGSWRYGADEARSAYRSASPLDERHSDYGFRLAQDSN